jgi:hypothetical protein
VDIIENPDEAVLQDIFRFSFVLGIP